MTKEDMLQIKTALVGQVQALDHTDAEMWRARMLFIADFAVSQVEKFDVNPPEGVTIVPRPET